MGKIDLTDKFPLPAGATRVVVREGTKYIPFGDSDPERIIVSMIEFQDRIYVATQKGVYIVKDDKLIRLEFVEKRK